MLISLGNITTGKKYFDRPDLNLKFWKQLEKVKHISIIAPRRVGKSSFMEKQIEICTEEQYKGIYVITESVKNANQFFKILYKEIIVKLDKSFWEGIEDTYKRLDIKKISTTGIEFGKLEIDFFEELKQLLKKWKNKNQKLVIFIDEFAQTIENIAMDENDTNAKQFLHQCRELRQDKIIRDKIHFVHAGSIGLESLVNKLGEPKSINDVGGFVMPSLTKDEGLAMIHHILNGEDYTFSLEDQHYLLNKLQWILPYYLQMMMSGIEDLCTENKTRIINKSTIDNAFENFLKERNYFDHWTTRLRTRFKGVEYSFLREVLETVAKNKQISALEIVNLAQQTEIDYSYLLRVLQDDGYLVFESDEKIYRFNSPLLREWWLRNMVI